MTTAPVAPIPERKHSPSMSSNSPTLFPVKVGIRHLFISKGHRYFGRHGKTPAAFDIESVPNVECIAGKGLKGDRFFGHKENFRGQITLFDWAVFEQLRQHFLAPAAEPGALRRNVLVEGLHLPELIGTRFDLQGVCLEGVEECRPCYWMDQAVAPGAEAWLKGRGGLRCRILSDGFLRRD